MSGNGNLPVPPARGYWSSEKLRHRLQPKGIISDYSEDRVDNASYRLRVGKEIYITPASEDVDPKYRTKRQLRKGEAVAIPPGQFAILCTEEIVTVPDDAMAFIGLRLTPKLRGLINVSGFQAEPTYSGLILFSVFNAGPSEVHVARGDEWFMISFLDLDAPTAEHRKKPGYSTIPTEFISSLSSEFLTIKGLKARIDSNREEFNERLHIIERDHTITRWAAVIVLGALISLGVRQCSSSDARAHTSYLDTENSSGKKS